MKSLGPVRHRGRLRIEGMSTIWSATSASKGGDEGARWQEFTKGRTVELFEWPKGCHSVCLYLIANTLQIHWNLTLPTTNCCISRSFQSYWSDCTAVAGHMPTSCCWTWHRRLSARCGIFFPSCWPMQTGHVFCTAPRSPRCMSWGGDSDCGWWSAFSLSGQHADHWPGQRQRMSRVPMWDWFQRLIWKKNDLSSCK